MARVVKYWLMKTEPDVYSIQDLAMESGKTTHWDGVRNYQARNFMRDEMKLGDRVLIYHSNTDPNAVVGTARVVREAYPDFTSWDHKNKHFDPKSTPDNPRWYMVDVQLEGIFVQPLPLSRLRQVKVLKGMELLRPGSRLSIQPVQKPQFDAIVSLAKSGK